MQLRLPLDLTVEADARDYRIFMAYLRLRSIRRTSHELNVHRATVREAIDRMEWVLRRAENCGFCTTGSKAAHF